MAFQIIWTHTAVEDLKGIVQYIALDDPDAAAKLADRIIQRIETASKLPFSNRLVPEKAEEPIREVILKPYRLIYQVDSHRSVIHILRIWHAAHGIPDIE
ncbi:MAG: type II toxin-antitoxin system RelE/ParE family toxin [Planctomycetota bacterium]|jgi:addiction module RelE/StbE family toxin